jgi:hypothetical protein
MHAVAARFAHCLCAVAAAQGLLLPTEILDPPEEPVDPVARPGAA